MSKNVAMFIDVANLYYAARGLDVDVDYVALLKHATKGRDLIRAYAYSGLDPENENQRKFIDFLSKNGYKVLTKDIRKFGDGRVKANLDIELVVDLFRLADRMDIAVIVSGDGDFAPAIRALQDKGIRCEVISFKPNTSSDLIAVADEFIDIMKIAGIGRAKGVEKGMSAPEMPAKEVTPEFGFREASPSVAAAALAALKTGGGGRGNGRSRTAARGATAPAPAAAEVAAATEEEPRRRRRRRGGRGRGRARAATTETSAASVSPGDTEPTWDELDDLSQLEGLGEEREYTFEEADEATLRELGMDIAVAHPAEPSDEKPRRRRTRAAAEPDEGSGAKPSATARRGRRAATPPAEVTEVADEAKSAAPRARRARRGTSRAESKPASAASKARGRTRRTPAEPPSDSASAAADTDRQATTAEGDAQPEGIWGRFRSGRGSRPA